MKQVNPSEKRNMWYEPIQGFEHDLSLLLSKVKDYIHNYSTNK
jgi:hypothetical protein